jgi:two-component system phosphate regulon sensor histidine kinase PhoR
MKKKKIVLISIIISISLLGIIFVQLFWIQNAFKLKEEQFNKSVVIALKTVVNQLLDYQTHNLSYRYDVLECNPEDQQHPVIEKIEPTMLESLMLRELGSIGVDKNFAYGIYNSQSGEFLMGTFENYKDEIKSSEHMLSLSCLYKSDQYLLAVHFTNKQGIIWSKIIGWVILSVLFIILMTVGFYMSVASILRQKRLSVMKTDFVNNMTHEFKTPISTISLASEMLIRKEIQQSPEKTSKYANIIFAENDRLKNQVEQILQISVLDKGDYKMKFRQVDLHTLVEAQAKNFRLILKERKGNLLVDLKATKSLIIADKIHVMNMISNLLDNAVKYTPCSPRIVIDTWNSSKGVHVRVKDNGIGISHENQKHVFKNLYRVPTGNLHDVKGFGLGLFYVKTMMESHGGHVSLKSELKKGSEFELFFPYEEYLTIDKDGVK